ncbi:hypothetical protein DRN93_00540 [archaeon]|nr:MAG: hypothetical protein DRN93_00540 [archaeon]HDN17789.1 OsmC family peroxiredoxin [Candidatus Bathyarchaeota archaeon]
MEEMKATAIWVDNVRSVVDNDRGHSVVMDLPTNLGGDDTGATALEFAVMALAGCVATIYELTLKKMRIELKSLKVEVEAEKPEGAKTIEKVTVTATVSSDAPEDRLKRAWELTLQSCPVGVLFEKAGVESSYNLKIA